VDIILFTIINSIVNVIILDNNFNMTSDILSFNNKHHNEKLKNFMFIHDYLLFSNNSELYIVDILNINKCNSLDNTLSYSINLSNNYFDIYCYEDKKIILYVESINELIFSVIH